ncbi:hypothetical protein V9L05_09195 [Bernardetia sp. Wsw4-3y2]|uniref:hypothetical protein n=1 Tax=Bernardetia sp. Wsw4-3y2 TaxID=3127471 RepID=UPI0030D10BBE
MKITKLLSLLLLCLVLLSNGCNEDDENENLGVEGNCDVPKCYISSVRTVTDSSDNSIIWQYKVINGEKFLDKFLRQDIEYYTEMSYDNNNRHIGSKDYYQNELSYESIVTYNNNGQKTNIKGSSYRNNSKFETIIKYDSKGRIKGTTYYAVELGYKEEFIVQEYNSFGQPTLVLLYDRHGNLWETRKYDYNNCKLGGNTKYISDNIFQVTRGQIDEYLYLGCGSGCSINKITYISENGRNPYITMTIFEYDERGLLESYYSVYDGDKIRFKSYFEYDCD